MKVFGGICVLAASVCVYAADETKLRLGAYEAILFDDGGGFVGLPEDLAGLIKDVWWIRMETDKITDKRVITARRDAFAISEQFGKIRLTTEISLFLDLSKAGEEVLCIAGHDFPGMTGIIRVDKNPPIKTNEDGCVNLTERLDTQLSGGSVITLRGHAWPYEGANDEDIQLGGFREMSSLLRSKR